MSRRETVERAAEQWTRELTDESGRNRLLYYRVLKRGTEAYAHGFVAQMQVRKPSLAGGPALTRIVDQVHYCGLAGYVAPTR